MDNESPPRKKHAKILVVDDNFILREFMETALLSDGHLCVCAEDGLAALDVLKQDTFDMVISDIEMPNLNGLELLSWIREKSLDIKTLLISGQYTSNDTINGLSPKDAHSFLSKPFSLDLFLSTVHKVLFTTDSSN